MACCRESICASNLAMSCVIFCCCFKLFFPNINCEMTIAIVATIVNRIIQKKRFFQDYPNKKEKKKNEKKKPRDVSTSFSNAFSYTLL